MRERTLVPFIFTDYKKIMKEEQDKVRVEQIGKHAYEIILPPPVPDIELSEDQSRAMEALDKWLIESKGKKEDWAFALTGSAGTGKTTLIGSFLKTVDKHFRKLRVCICAPTHKAKKVIQQKTKWSNAETLQALLGLKVDVNLENFDINNPQFKSIGERRIKDYDLVVVDESSMVNRDLYTTIEECAKEAGAKVLFTGDTLQLNPVKETSVSLSLIVPTYRYDLTQVIRQSVTNPLLELLYMLREDIKGGTSKFLEHIKKYPNSINPMTGEGFVLCDAQGFSDVMNVGFSSKDFNEDRNFCRYISWTNQSIQDVNKHIRKVVLRRESALVEGELLLCYKTINSEKLGLLMVNSDDYIIEKIVGTGSHVEFSNINVTSIVLQGIDTGSKTKVNVVTPGVENYKAFVEVHDNLIHKAKYRNGGARAWIEFFKFREQFVLLETLMENKTLISNKDIDYGYGITIHKSQGSTYNTVFVNGKDINRNFTEIERKRLWYVALSRASNKVYIHL